MKKQTSYFRDETHGTGALAQTGYARVTAADNDLALRPETPGSAGCSKSVQYLAPNADEERPGPTGVFASTREGLAQAGMPSRHTRPRTGEAKLCKALPGEPGSYAAPGSRLEHRGKAA
ncbi:MAG: hypothetical protein Q7J52_08870 [Falsiroseomonas sp.]|nr:hypothetical protein [Falsiroseomonas sp.]